MELGCTQEQCVNTCPYHNEAGKISDIQIIGELFRNIKIVDFDDYKRNGEKK